jgi:hypothetical protein
MSKSRLVVQDAKILPAFVFAPVAGLSALWLSMVLYDLYNQQFSPFRELLVLPWFFMFGLPLCLLIEAIVVFPIIKGFERYKWSWLNGWSACAIGFLIGALPCFILTALEVRGANPTHTAWVDVFRQSATCGIVGIVGAFVFQAIAVREAP